MDSFNLNRLEQKIKSGSIFLAIACIAISACCLVKWLFTSLSLEGFFSFQHIIKPNSAVCFILLSTSILLLNNEKRNNWIPKLLPLLVTVLSAFTFLEYLMGFETPLDLLLVGEKNMGFAYIVRMAPISTISFIVLGLCLLQMSRDSHWMGIQLSTIAVWTVALLALFSFAEGGEQFAIAGTFTHTSFLTSLTFIVLVFSMLMSHPQKGLLAMVLSKGIAGNVARRLLPFAISVPLILAILRLVAERVGWLNTALGNSLYITSIVISFLLLVWWTVKNIERIENHRRAVEESLKSTGTFIKDYESRVNRIMDVVLKYTTMDFSEKLVISEKGDEIDAIALALNTLSEEIQFKNIALKQNEDRINEIMDTLLMYTMMDFSKQLKLSDQNDEWDAVALGLNTLGEELNNALARDEKRRVELEETTAELSRKNEILSAIAKVREVLQGQKTVEVLGKDLITRLCELMQASVGALYITESENQLRFLSGYAYSGDSKRNIAFGETLVGQAAQQGQPLVLYDVPASHLKLSSTFMETRPTVLYIVPFKFEGTVIAVVELGLMKDLTEIQKELLELIGEGIAIAFNSSISREKLQELYQQTHQLAEELESQQEELRQTNEELQKQTERLQTSEEELKVQQEELQQANAELEEKSNSLAEKNQELVDTQNALIVKAEEIAQASRYKSEFLANMSHELRTPLNSVLILAKLLSDNKPKNLNEKQVEYAKIIHKSGSDLLNLINDILDLSKIEARKIELQIEKLNINELESDLYALFKELANTKKIEFKINLSSEVKQVELNTDKVRMEQILRNLLSNAFKFTEEGGKVELAVQKAEQGVMFSVSDTGIGIPSDKLPLIFEAFRQADGSTSRRFGGTGLGLSISKELTSILGGKMLVESVEGKGSKFSLYLPMEIPSKSQEVSLPVDFLNQQPASDILTKKEVPVLKKEDRTLLIIEDDVNFAGILSDYAKEREYNVIVAYQGDTGLKLAALHEPDAIILDLNLPVMDGWTVLKKLKEDSKLKKIPVHLISGSDKQQKGMSSGAVAFIQKPITQERLSKAFDDMLLHLNTHIKSVLIIEDNIDHNQSISELLRSERTDVECYSAFSGKEALEMLSKRSFDCIILDLSLKDVSGYELIEKIKSNPALAAIPVIVNTGKSLSEEEERKLKKHAATVVIKSTGSSKRLLDETTLFLNKLDESVPPKEKQKRTPAAINDVLKDKTVLLVDDDMRNVFSLMAALEQQGLKVIAAADGKEAMDLLSRNPIDLILMDIMMPKMDGYEAIRQIRSQKKHEKLPIIALTAKAMKGDREKCLEAGASDYISKPVSIDQLSSLMRAWLYK